MEETKAQAMENVVLDFLNDKKNLNLTPNEIESGILTLQRQRFESRNYVTNDKGGKSRKPDYWKIPLELSPSQIATILSKKYNIIKLSASDEQIKSEYDILAVYEESGYNKGIYTTDTWTFKKMIRKYNYNIKEKDEDEVLNNLKTICIRKEKNKNMDYVAVNNGIFNYETKKLLEFSPDIIFTSKSHVNYNDKAKNPIIYNKKDDYTWDIETWLIDLFDGDMELVNLMWEIFSAILRPYVPWDKAAWFYSDVGSNGKGTIVALMRNLLGKGAYASIPLDKFGEEFMLEPLMSVNAILVDENDVGSYIDKAANLKAIVTNDIISINRKHKSPIVYQFHGFMVQCLNGFPKAKDRSDSFYRRQLFVPFTKSFTGIAKKYIKYDYMKRTEVLEYIMYKALNSNFYELSQPKACEIVLDTYKEYNDPVREFWNEFKHQFTWDLLPYAFLHDLYKAWIQRNFPHSKPLQRNTFIDNLISITKAPGDVFIGDSSKKQIRVKQGDQSQLLNPEPLIYEYNLLQWKNQTYVGTNIDKISTTNPKSHYRGLERI